MTTSSVKELFGIEDLKDLPDAIMKLLFSNKENRNAVYRRLLALNGHDVSQDWFQQFYEEELAERSQKKQDFTPYSLGILAARLTGLPYGIVSEPAAGNGGMLIAYWWQKCLQTTPFQFRPSSCVVSCWELSSRSIPILLLNLSIRGIMGEVIHGDVLEKAVKTRYVLLNEYDDFLAFSDIVVDNNVQF